MDRTIQEKIDLTIEWLRQKVKESNTKGLVVGVSGGIDSALVAFLIQKAFPENSIGVILPCKSNCKDREDAIKVVEVAGIKHVEVDLSEAHDKLFNNVYEQFNEKEDLNLKLSDANLRARLRMSTIYTVANLLNYLVVGTDNAAELYTGYFTKYGDGGVDILPLAHLRKSEVYDWSRYLGVPQSVIDRPPSAGLWEGQTDEDEMGTTYSMVDKFLLGEDIPSKDREIIEMLHKRTEHKRNVPVAPPVY